MAVTPSFFMPKFKAEGGVTVFSNELLSIIFAKQELQELDCETQSRVVHAIERSMEEYEDEYKQQSLSATDE